MRNLTTHIVEGDSSNHQLQIAVTDNPGHGGAYHRYEITGLNTLKNESRLDPYEGVDKKIILFQNGPIKEFGVNGLTQESLLAIIIDRLECFQNGPFKSDYNQEALEHCQKALNALQKRTRERISRGVEGQNKV